MNRGFHLEYYGDTTFHSKFKMSHLDPETSKWSRTFNYLYDKVTTNKDYKLFYIELFTLLSLAQHRHKKGLLEEVFRVKLKIVCDDVLGSGKILHAHLQHYIIMMKEHFEKYSAYASIEAADLLFKLKELPRSGWIKRSFPQKTLSESIADHTFGAVILGIIYLPKKYEKAPGYNKEHIIMMLIAHDLGEAIIGDPLPDQWNEDMKKKETKAYEYLSMLETYPEIHGLNHMKNLWEEFERGGTVNAKLAKDLDKLDMMVQLRRSLKHGATLPLTDTTERDLRNSLSDIGKKLFFPLFDPLKT